MRRNYRSTHEILSWSTALLIGRPFAELEDDARHETLLGYRSALRGNGPENHGAGSADVDRLQHEADLLASPLAVRLYDLRHSGLSTRLNAGVDPTEVAERAGISVEVLMTRYARCLFSRQALADRRVDALPDEYG